MKKFGILVVSLLMTTGLIGCQHAEETSNDTHMQSVSGVVTYRERVALPANALITVSLQDISLADAPAIVLAKQSIEADGKQVPFAFDLPYDSNNLKQGHTYSVSARIELEGKLLFITDTVYPVISDANQTHLVELTLIKAGG
ncbi:YbaY family lipoprotein [Vibrio sonorensis]|uniref:YbaY family lipoprotein n=1 Tax=Vibrio sonorensis TaxID=1004316 RepID=UPI0008DA1EE7|nr:YbaY family lipoprotein [Vibrio sonorensis]